VSRPGKPQGSPLTLMEQRRLLVFSDLDGSLLDPISYAWEPAAPMLSELQQENVPLILCTSKTRAEVDALRRKMGHRDPYIAENGALLVLPWRFLGKANLRGPYTKDYVLRLGWSYGEVLRTLAELARRAKVRVRGFHQMTAAEVSRSTGLTLAEARKAKQREASEPFRFVDASEAQIRTFRQMARGYGFKVAEGERFWHLMMGADKGQAMALVTYLAEIVEDVRVRTIAVGDSRIDLSMLQQADFPIVMPRSDGAVDAQLLRLLPDAVRASAAGPEAWAEAVHSAVLGHYRNAAQAVRKPHPVAAGDSWRVAAPREAVPAPSGEVRWKSPTSRKTASLR